MTRPLRLSDPNKTYELISGILSSVIISYYVQNSHKINLIGRVGITPFYQETGQERQSSSKVSPLER
jgi:hypothetical protein